LTHYRHFLTITDLQAAEVERLFRLAARCKRDRGIGRKALAGKQVALVFQKPSVRTRVSFEVAIRQLGGSSIYLGPDDAQLDTREPVCDVARTMSRYVDGIVVRTFTHAQVEEFARCAAMPVINGLSDLHHPCQALADLFTIQERHGRLRGLTIAYIGDGNNVLHSLAQCAGLLGVNLRCAIPDGYRPDLGIWQQAGRLARGARSEIVLHDDPRQAARGAEVIYTDVWTSMGQERERRARRKAFRGFQVSRTLLACAKPGCVVMHCLPAHRGEEITDEVLEGPRSIVFDQAENRLHVQKALLLLLFGGTRQ
jgi:ornithine carbamoyltransferase